MANARAMCITSSSNQAKARESSSSASQPATAAPPNIAVGLAGLLEFVPSFGLGEVDLLAKQRADVSGHLRHELAGATLPVASVRFSMVKHARRGGQMSASCSWRCSCGPQRRRQRALPGKFRPVRGQSASRRWTVGRSAGWRPRRERTGRRRSRYRPHRRGTSPGGARANRVTSSRTPCGPPCSMRGAHSPDLTLELVHVADQRPRRPRGGPRRGP